MFFLWAINFISLPGCSAGCSLQVLAAGSIQQSVSRGRFCLNNGNLGLYLNAAPGFPLPSGAVGQQILLSTFNLSSICKLLKTHCFQKIFNLICATGVRTLSVCTGPVSKTIPAILPVHKISNSTKYCLLLPFFLQSFNY
jgi:hypothetical protein